MNAPDLRPEHLDELAPVPAAEERPADAGPAEWEADVVLRDGSVAHVRPIRPSDGELIHAFHARQSSESIYLRFFAPIKRLSDKDVHRFTHVDHRDRVALVATLREEIIGIGRFDRLPAPQDDRAEVAFNISDAHAGKGIGSILLEHLAAIGDELDVRQFVADVLPQNRKMMGVFTDAGFEVSHYFDDGVIAVSFDIEPTERNREVRLAREHRAESVSVRALLHPQAIAVVGVSRRERSIGHRIFRNLVEGGYQGSVFVVNNAAEEVLGYPAHNRVSDIGERIDLAIIAVPAEEVLDATRDCAAANVHAVMVVSSGFAESGPRGRARQVQLLRLARGAGMRLVGPNSFGLINTDPAVSMNATLTWRMPQAGSFGLFAQSGALGVGVLAQAARRGLGLSTFASAGNRADVSGNDLMQYWIDDDQTTAVGLYLETMGNPRKFSRISRHLATVKPVIVIKSGVGENASPPGHTVRSTQTRPEAFQAMLGQAGVIRVDSLHELFDVAQIVVNQPLPQGRRIAVVGNSTALGALTADAATAWGFEVIHGPVTLSHEAEGPEFREAIRTAFDDPDVDSVIVCFIPPLFDHSREVARGVAEAATSSDKPLLAVYLGNDGLAEELRSHGETVPAYPLPEDAVRALAAVTRYAEWRQRDQGALVQPEGIDPERAQDLVERILADAPQGRPMTREEIMELCEAYGIRLAPAVIVDAAEEAVHAANAVGYPVVLSARLPTGARVWGHNRRDDLQEAEAIRAAFYTLERHLGDPEVRYVVQTMPPEGVECVLTSHEDPLFGPVISFSLLGMPADLLGDIGHRIPPLTEVDVSDLIDSIKGAPLLKGYAGAPPVDRRALEDLIARLSVLADDLPDVASVRLEPVVCHDHGVEVLGAQVHVRPAVGRMETARRSLALPPPAL